MSNFSGHRLNNGVSLLKALDAATNWRAFVIYLVASLVYFGFVLLGVGAESEIVTGLTMLIGFVIAMIGVNAAGHLLMDQARGIALRSTVDALLSGIFTLHRLIGLFLIMLLAFAALVLAIAILLLLSKIPGIGPALFTVTFPVGTIMLGLATLVSFYLAIGMLAPSVWEGQGILASLARLWVVLRERLLLVTVNMFLLTLLVILVGTVIFVTLLVGGVSMLGLAATIISDEIQGEMLGMMMHFSQSLLSGHSSSFSGYFSATIYGAGLLYLIATSLIGMILLSGFCQIYLQATQGLTFDAAEEQINQRLEEAKRRAQEAQARAREASERARASANEAARTAHSGAGEQVDTAAKCPQCGAPVAADDVFCGECGHKLKN